MPTILICTDFSESAENAISYVFKMSVDRNSPLPLQFILYHLFEIPASYSVNGISLTTLDRELRLVEEKLNDECSGIKALYPELNISPKLSTGPDLRTGLENEIRDLDPYLIIIGESGNYSDILSWDKEIIAIIRELSVPVLIIPKKVCFAPIKKIAFSCNLKNVNRYMPFHLIIRLVNFTGGQLFVLFIKTEGSEVELTKAESMVRENLQLISPIYFSVREKSIVQAVSTFVKENGIDVLLVTPRKHGIWDNLIYKNHAKELVKLNSIPILALRQNN